MANPHPKTDHLMRGKPPRQSWLNPLPALYPRQPLDTQAQLLSDHAFVLADLQARHISAVLQRGNAKEMRSYVPSAMMAFGISSDKVLRRAAEAKVKPPTQNLVLQLFGAQADRIAGALSQGVHTVITHDASAMPTLFMPSDQPSNSCANAAHDSCKTHSTPLRDEALNRVDEACPESYIAEGEG